MAGGSGLDRLKADLKQNTPARLYVFYGPEAYLRSHYLDQLHRLLVEDFAEAFNYHRFRGENVSLQGVLNSIEAIPMMAARSMVQIDDVNFFALGEDGADYARFLSDIPDYCTVVLVYDTVEFKIDKRRKALTQAFENAVLVEFTQPTERELITWVGRHFRKRQKQITVEDARYLIQRTGGAMVSLLAEIEKLSAYGTSDTVTRQEIDLLVEPVLEAMTFDLSDAIAAGRYELAMEKLQILLQKQEEPVLILGAISSQMRRILTARRLSAAGKNQQDLMRLCGIGPYPAQKTMEYARRVSDRFCAEAVNLCLEADRQMKTSYDEPERILELLVIRLAGEARHD